MDELYTILGITVEYSFIVEFTVKEIVVTVFFFLFRKRMEYDMNMSLYVNGRAREVC